MKIICIGRNYLEHAKELDNAVPEEPIFFMKPDSALLRNNAPFFYPDFSNEIHHEIELVVRINRLGKNIAERFASRYYQEVALGVDFTARDLQRKCKQKGLPWEIAKAFDASAPISEFINLQEIGGNVQDINLRLDINGKTVQNGNTREMLFAVNELIAYISRFMTLKIGDLIYTGTPHGVGQVTIGDHLEGWLQNIKLLNFEIK